LSIPREGFDVLALGELCPDLILTGISAGRPTLGVEQEFTTYQLTLGSSTAITCTLMQRLGLKTAMISSVGNDEYGRFCREALEVDGVDTRLVEICPDSATGITICLPYPEDRLLLTCKGAMARLRGEAVDDELLQKARHLHTGSFFIQSQLRPGLTALFAKARGMGLTTSLDTGWDPEERWLTDDLITTLAQTDYFFPNEVEFEKLTGGSDLDRGIEKLINLGVGTVVVKRGAMGAIHATTRGTAAHRGFITKSVDTTGAGDAFNAGYLTAMMLGAAVPDRLAFGNACGALTVSAVGGTGGVFNIQQVRAFIANQGGTVRQ
jgi:sugar/nucleoside kinase (ribokinase family)